MIEDAISRFLTRFVRCRTSSTRFEALRRLHWRSWTLSTCALDLRLADASEFFGGVSGLSGGDVLEKVVDSLEKIMDVLSCSLVSDF